MQPYCHTLNEPSKVSDRYVRLSLWQCRVGYSYRSTIKYDITSITNGNVGMRERGYPNQELGLRGGVLRGADVFAMAPVPGLFSAIRQKHFARAIQFAVVELACERIP